MPKIKYETKRIGHDRLAIIEKANSIIAEYQAAGFRLTLRQLYYQFVARGLIPNKVQEYKKLGDIISDGRMGGLIDWSAIADRLREATIWRSYNSPAECIETAKYTYAIDLWQDQRYRPEVWVEKDALSEIVEQECSKLNVPFLVCRGYTSQTAMWESAQRMRKWIRRDQTPIVFHFGDHDPSGVDMSRDIEDRLALFARQPIGFKRIALNRAQVEKYDPPPNPTKQTDSRCAGYEAEHGDEGWELDALEPTVLARLIRDAIKSVMDEDKFKTLKVRQELERQQIAVAGDRWDAVVDALGLDDLEAPEPEDDDEEDDDGDE